MKKTTIRKITAALLCALLLSAPMGTNLPGGFPLTASAAGYSGTCGENLTWTLDTDTGILAISGTGAMWDYSSSSNAPWYSKRSSIREVPIANGVTSIGDYAFRGCTGLTSVTIPDSVTSIGNSAFWYCTSLTSVTIGDSVTSIGDEAFRYCTSLTSVTIPDSVTSIGDEAFSNCTSLTSVTIPDSVTSIGNSAFWYCTSLTSVTIPDSVTSIDDYVFANCTSLTSVTIPDSVKSIGGGAFWGCTSLTSVTIGDSITSIGKEAFSYCTGLTSVTIPDSVTSIDDYVFANCTSLTSVTIPDSVKSIGVFAFDNTEIYNNASNWENDVLYIGNHLIEAETSITGDYLVKSGTKTIADDAFFGCTSLTSVTIPDSVTSIGDHAFYDCTSLTSVTIPDSVTSIGSSAFSHCTSLTSVTIGDSVTSIGDYVFYDCTSLTSVTIPDSVTSIGWRAFEDCTGLTSVTIPDSVTSIGSSAFSHCTSLTSVTIPDSVTSIGSYAFEYCTSLTSVTIPNGVTSIGADAFADCSSLNYVHIPASVTSIGESILEGSPAYICSDTAECYAKEYAEANGIEFRVCSEQSTSVSGTCGENLTWTLNTTTGILTITGTGEMEDFSFGDAPWYNYNNAIQKVKVESGVTSIGDSAFYCCTSLTSISLPDSLTNLGHSAFHGCSSLVGITLPNSVTSIGYCTFEDCTSLISIAIPEGVTSIGMNNFFGCTSLKSIMLPNSIKRIEQFAFVDCVSLTNIIIPNGATGIGWSAFDGCSSLKSIAIPDTVTSVGDFAFRGCTSLTSIIVDAANQFYSSDSHGVLFDKNKTKLIHFPAGSTFTEYTIPDSVTSIGDDAFSYCTRLTSVTIPDSVTSIGSFAFEYCSSLNYVHIPASVTSIGESILDESPAYICSDTAECSAKEYAEANGIEFRVCDGHGAAEPEPPKFDGTTGTVQADCTPGCFDEDAHLVVSESDKTLPEFGITVSGYVQVQKTYNIQVQNAHGQPLQPKSGHTVTLRLPLPLDDHGNPYDAGKYSVYHLIDNDPANTESFRAKKGNLKIENGFLVIEVSHFSPFVVVVESEMPTVSIAGNPGTATLRYKETLVLHAEAENLPDGASLLWEADKNGIVELKPSGDGTTCEIISKKTGDVRITVKVVDADGSEIEGSGSDTETVQSKAGFFQKLLAFFRLLFGIKVRIDQRKK